MYAKNVASVFQQSMMEQMKKNVNGIKKSMNIHYAKNVGNVLQMTVMEQMKKNVKIVS